MFFLFLNLYLNGKNVFDETCFIERASLMQRIFPYTHELVCAMVLLVKNMYLTLL